jgi:TonB family protein
MTTGVLYWLNPAIFTGWVFAITMGLVGMLFPYNRPVLLRSEPPIQILEAVDIELAPQQENLALALENEPIIDEEELPKPLTATPPEIPRAYVPKITAVATPSEVNFAVPVEGPVRVVDVTKADYAIPKETSDDSTLDPHQIETIVFGQGKGRQPAPHYPWKAIDQGQEGRVSVVFCVGKNGRVLSGELSQPSPWPMLNKSALRTICNQWHFSCGGIRYYEVTILFELNK